MKTRLKPMGAREILDVTFTILRERFWTFQGVIFYSFLPATVLILIGLTYLASIMFSNGPAWIFNNPEPLEVLGERLGFPGVLFLIVLMLLTVISMLIGSMFYLYGNIRVFHFGLHQAKCTVRQAFQGIGKKWLWYFLFSILAGVITTVALIPGVLLTALLSLLGLEELHIAISLLLNVFQIGVGFFICLVPTVIAVENDTDVIKALIRGFTLMKGHCWRILGILILTYLLGYALMFVIMGIVATPIILACFNQNLLWITLAGLSAVLGLFILNIMLSYYFGPLTAIYYDLVIRKEAYDLKLQLNEPATVTGPPSAAPNQPR